MCTSNGALLVFMKLSFNKTKYKARLANSRLSKQHNLELAHSTLYCSIWTHLSSHAAYTMLNTLDWRQWPTVQITYSNNTQYAYCADNSNKYCRIRFTQSDDVTIGSWCITENSIRWSAKLYDASTSGSQCLDTALRIVIITKNYQNVFSYVSQLQLTITVVILTKTITIYR